MSYTELIMRSRTYCDQSIYGPDARSIVAKALDGMDVSPVLFAREKIGAGANGIPQMTPIIYSDGRGFLRMYGVGPVGKEVIRKELGNIYTGLSALTESPIALDIREGMLAFKPGRLRFYNIRRLALAKPGKRRGKQFFAVLNRYLKNKDKEAAMRDLDAMISEVIETGLSAIAERSLIDLPKNLDIKIHDGLPGIFRIHNDRPGHAGVLKRLRFSMNGELVGPWSVGLLRSYGFGLIRREISR